MKSQSGESLHLYTGPPRLMLGKFKQKVSKEASQEGSREEQSPSEQKTEPGHSLPSEMERMLCKGLMCPNPLRLYSQPLSP